MMVGYLHIIKPMLALPLAEMALITGYSSMEIRQFIAGTKKPDPVECFIALPDGFPIWR